MTHRHLERIRFAARAVASSTSHVRVDAAAVERSARRWDGALGRSATFEPPTGIAGRSNEERLAFLLARGAVRFGTGWLNANELEQRISSGLRSELESGAGLDATRLSEIEVEAVAAMFTPAQSVPAPVELADLWARGLRDLGRFVTDKYAGRFSNVVESCASVDEWIERLSSMPYFRDVQRYRGLAVPFFWRSQRIALDVSRELESRGAPPLAGIDDLVISSDARAVAALRAEGILEIEPSFEIRIDHGESIPAHSEREIELRAVSIHAMELVARSMGTTDVVADRWLRAVNEPPQKRGPRTRSVFY